MKYYKNLSIDESDFSVQRQGCRIHLTTTEYQLFITLLDHSGHICSRNFLLASAWNITVPIQTRTVDVHIAKLRKKLDLGPDDLKTVMGRGYALSVWSKQEIKIFVTMSCCTCFCMVSGHPYWVARQSYSSYCGRMVGCDVHFCSHASRTYNWWVLVYIIIAISLNSIFLFCVVFSFWFYSLSNKNTKDQLHQI